jgi:hypothetical protein
MQIDYARKVFSGIIKRHGRDLHAAGWTREALFEGATTDSQILCPSDIPGIVAACMGGWWVSLVTEDRVELSNGTDFMAKLRSGVMVAGDELARHCTP